MEKHTELPWEINRYRQIVSNGKVIFVDGVALSAGKANPTGEANAAFIVKACNTHYAMLESLKNMTQLTRLKYGNLDKDVFALIEKAEQVIEQAESNND